MVMKQYDSYKPSGVEWIGQIPSHWETNRIKETTNFEGGSFEDGDWIESKDISETGIRYLTSGNVGVIDYVEQGNGFISEDTFSKLKCKEVFEGDILISRLNEPISRACIIPNLYSRIVTCVDNVIYRPDLTKYNRSFIVYTLNSVPYTDYVNLIARGVTMSRIARTSLGKQKIPLPPLEEQERIAEYLDRRCAEIDGIINKEEQAIALLDELKQSIISEAVIRGLDPAVPIKPSGVDWIGQIPNHWEVRRLKYVVSCNDEVLSEMTPPLSVINYVEISDVTYINGIKGSTEFEFKDAPSRARRVTRVNDVIISTVRTYLKAIARVIEPDVIVSTGFAVLRAHSIDDLYLSYVVKSSGFIDDVVANSFGVTYPSITASKLISLSVPLPPLEEQDRIAEYLDKRCAEIDEAKERKQRQIELLREMKQIIISDAVTGHVKVF